MQVQRSVPDRNSFQPVAQAKPRILEQNAEIHQIGPEKKEKNFPIWIIIGLLVFVIFVIGAFTYFYLTR